MELIEKILSGIPSDALIVEITLHPDKYVKAVEKSLGVRELLKDTDYRKAWGRWIGRAGAQAKDAFGRKRFMYSKPTTPKKALDLFKSGVGKGTRHDLSVIKGNLWSTLSKLGPLHRKTKSKIVRGKEPLIKDALMGTRWN